MALSSLAERARVALYSALAETGQAPSRAELEAAVGESRDAVTAALTELGEAHHIVLEDGDVVLAHPFATRSFRFSVMGPGALWWGGCAWDAFAIPNLVPGAASVLVATTCPACQTAHAWTVNNQGAPAGTPPCRRVCPQCRTRRELLGALALG